MNKVAAPRGRAILVVDDEKNIRFTVVHALKSDRFEVDSASSGVEALAKCRAREYDLLLVDLRMPGMTGLEMLNEIRRERPNAPPAVIITAHGIARELFEAASLGVIDCVRKPFSIQSIRSTVRDVLARIEESETEEDQAAELHGVGRLLRQAKLHLMHEDCAGAIPLLDEAARLDPASSEAQCYLGLCHLLREEREEAMARFRYVQHVDPANRMAAEYLSLLAS